MAINDRVEQPKQPNKNATETRQPLMQAVPATDTNILSEYNSFSYYHVLLACKTTKCANAFLFRNDFFGMDIERKAVDADKLAVRSLVDHIDSSGVWDYIIVINGATDAELMIDSVVLNTALEGDTDDLKKNPFLHTSYSGQISISEPYGFKFPKIIDDVSRRLGRDFNNISWVLKTIFVCHKSTGETDVISDVPPFIFAMTHVGATYDVAGGFYDIEGAGLSGNFAHSPVFSEVCENITLELRTWDSDLYNDKALMYGAVPISRFTYGLKNLESMINDKYEQYRRQMQLNYEMRYSDIDAKPFNEVFSFVKYKITFSDVYLHGYDKISGGEPRYMIIKGSSNTSVFDMIEKLLSKVDKIKTDIDVNNEENKKRGYVLLPKILTDVDIGIDVTTVTYHVAQVKVPISSKHRDYSMGDLIEFEYIYSGKNTEIIDFEMKMPMVMTYLNMLRDYTSGLTSPEDIAMGVVRSNMKQAGTPVPTSEKTPLFLWSYDGMTSERINRPSTESFRRVLSNAVYSQVPSGSMTIRGNPYLIGRMHQADTDIGAAPRINFAYAKINIYMPDEPQIAGGDELWTVDRWYDGIYKILAIETRLMEGNFAQILHLVAMPEESGVILDPLEKYADSGTEFNTKSLALKDGRTIDERKDISDAVRQKIDDIIKEDLYIGHVLRVLAKTDSTMGSESVSGQLVTSVGRVIHVDANSAIEHINGLPSSRSSEKTKILSLLGLSAEDISIMSSARVQKMSLALVDSWEGNIELVRSMLLNTKTDSTITTKTRGGEDTQKSQDVMRDNFIRYATDFNELNGKNRTEGIRALVEELEPVIQSNYSAIRMKEKELSLQQQEREQIEDYRRTLRRKGIVEGSDAYISAMSKFQKNIAPLYNEAGREFREYDAIYSK